MPKIAENINHIRELHRTGHLEQAKQGYLRLLRKNPKHIEALHSVGVISAQQKNFSQAVTYLQQAIHFQPAEPTIQLHLANVLKIQGAYSEAAKLLEKTVESHPNYVPAFNNLGTIYYAKGDITKAIELYKKAISKEPNYADAYYNLGLALTKNNQPAEAIGMLQRLLEHVPDHFAARFHLGCAYMQQELFDKAIETFSMIETSHPHHFETQTNLATCYLKQCSWNNAKIHYAKALELNPEDTQTLFNLGYLHMQQNNLDMAIQYYQRTVNINPNLFAAQNNLAVAFLSKPHIALALQHFREALRIQPDNKSIPYTIQALEQNQPLISAPPDYVQSLFDSYADHYESHLLNALDYRIPMLFKKTLLPFISSTASLDILDLGCGTGLCGALFKPYAKSLTGVDLSPNMLAVAAEKKLFDKLITQELTEFLMQKHQQFDLILAGDVVVYLGDLTNLFNLVKQALRTRGIFIFNAEICQESSFKMNQSGRFSHSKDYIDSQITKNNFTIHSYQNIITRQQNNQPVYGHLYVASLSKS
ncbi:MAG: tetratricopeptide repeat protein [Gammaproteobacteria bacterium]|nr:tetratricopeptide repeat protein [Gammaproteobacteria bacterium]